MVNFLDAFDLRNPRKKLYNEDDPFATGMDTSIETPDMLAQPSSNNSATSGPGEYSNSEGTDPYADPSTDEYLAHLRNRPRRAEHGSSVGRKIAGTALQALLGNDFGVANRPYTKAVEDWEDKGSGLKESAQIEQKGLIERRRRLNDVMRNQRVKREYDQRVAKTNQQHEVAMKRLSLIEDAGKRAQAENEERADRFKQIMDHKSWAESNIALPMVRNAQRRTDIAERAVDQRSDPRVNASEQARIDDEAIKLVSKDSRFAKYYVPADPMGRMLGNKKDQFNDVVEMDKYGKPKRDKAGNFVPKERMDEVTKSMLARALAQARDKIANKRRSDFSSPYGFDSLDWQMTNDPLGDDVFDYRQPSDPREDEHYDRP